MRNVLFGSIAVVSAVLLVAGCRSEREDAVYKPAEKNGEVERAHAKGPHGGDTFDLGQEHNYRFEVVFEEEEPRTLTVYLLEHDTDDPVYTDQQELTLNVKVDDKPVSLTLKAAPQEGEKEGRYSRFQASGDEIPAAIEDEHELAGARFTVTVDGTPYTGTIEGHGHDDHDH